MRTGTGASFTFAQMLSMGTRSLVLAWRRVAGDSYRPEKHYMRGPGPKWREKCAHAVARCPADGRHRKRSR